MNNRNVIAGLIVLMLIAIGAYAIVGHKKTNIYSSNNTSTTVKKQIDQKPTSSSTDIIQTESDSSGQFLADNSGHTLYTYGADTNGKSNCSGACLATWPIYKATSQSGSNLPANVSVIQRDDGSMQYAYKGLPLYTFTSDTKGHMTGDGISNFHLAKP